MSVCWSQLYVCISLLKIKIELKEFPVTIRVKELTINALTSYPPFQSITDFTQKYTHTHTHTHTHKHKGVVLRLFGFLSVI